ncbi:MAG: serine protease, partial [Nitrospirales bacterium]
MGDETMRRTVKSVTGRSLLVAFAAAWLGATPPPAWSTEGPTSSQIERAMRATVGILQHPQESPSPAQGARFSVRGSGFHLRDGYIITARHAVKRQKGGTTIIPETITVVTRDLEELPAALIGVNAFVDLAVYRVSLGSGGESLTPLSFSPREPEPGQQMFTIGYPLGWGPAVAFGRVGNPNTYVPTARSRLFQIDLSSCSGNSGVAVFNAQGEIVGMVQAIIQ